MKPLKAWAVLDPERVDRIYGGNVRCAIFWTRGGIKLEQTKNPDLKGKKIIPVIVHALKGFHK